MTPATPAEEAGSANAVSPFERIRQLEARVRELERADTHPLSDPANFRQTMTDLRQGYCIGEILVDDSGTPIDYRFIDVNDLFETMTGLSDAIGRRAYEMVPNLEPHWLETYSRVGLGRESIHFENGSEALGRWFDVFAAPVEPHGRFMLLFQDATERHLAETALQESETHLRAALSRSGTVVFEQDRDLVFTWAHTHELAIAADELLGHTDYDVVADPEEAEALASFKREVMEKGERLQRVLEISRAGERRWFDIRAEPRRNPEGEVIGLIGSAYDLTEHMERQTALDEANNRLIQVSGEADVAREAALKASRAKSDFLAAMSHDLRTPLNAIGGYVELLEMGIHGPITPSQQDALKRVATNQRHLLALIDDILSFAQLESGRLRLEIGEFDVAAMVESVDALIAPIAGARGVQFTGTSAASTASALGDEERVRQILQNLVGNAIKFTPEGGRVGLHAATREDLVLFAVSDTGPGIEPDQFDSIFNPFYQIDRAHNRPKEGVGLGLSISRDLAEAMGGKLTVESSVGEGSTFTLALPLA